MKYISFLSFMYYVNFNIRSIYKFTIRKLIVPIVYILQLYLN